MSSTERLDDLDARVCRLEGEVLEEQSSFLNRAKGYLLGSVVTLITVWGGLQLLDTLVRLHEWLEIAVSLVILAILVALPFYLVNKFGQFSHSHPNWAAVIKGVGLGSFVGMIGLLAQQAVEIDPAIGPVILGVLGVGAGILMLPWILEHVQWFMQGRQ